MLKIAVIGAGYWGEKIIEKLEKNDHLFNIACICDITKKRVEPYKKKYATLNAVSYTHLTLPTKRIV